ncbi:hypothetical protein FHS19_005175 [Paenibacillus rhizosphaerae]|uniref:Uncharacterized protein n=1 Tax=Paenibacillus rhizosphaerae TaxID=297318 RepID=A0A839TY27_9BACL|nr:hypothetical protein [Paenibacillus rhizosphaerae]MBB3130470.1 hypothetical protein [Paenibacillus rhizosphaerae]
MGDAAWIAAAAGERLYLDKEGVTLNVKTCLESSLTYECIYEDYEWFAAVAIKSTKGYGINGDLNFLSKKLAIELHTWYILIPAKKTSHKALAASLKKRN